MSIAERTDCPDDDEQPLVEPGYYWVKCEDNAVWEPAEWDGERWSWIGDDEAALPMKIGPRLSPPELE